MEKTKQELTEELNSLKAKIKEEQEIATLKKELFNLKHPTILRLGDGLQAIMGKIGRKGQHAEKRN